MDRQKAIINRIEQQLISDGHVKKEVFQSSPTGFGDLNSFFELLVDLKLEGKSEISSEEVWENMKKQINHLNALVAHADKEYRKLQNETRGLKQDLDDLIKKRD